MVVPSLTLPIALAALTGLLGFIVGAVLQQDASYRNIQSTMANDPYIYQRRQQIFDATMFFTFSLGHDTSQLPDSAHVATLMKYGFPGLDDVHVYRNFVLSYDRRNRIAHWVCEHLESECLTETPATIVQKPAEFLIDSSIPLIFRASQLDYRNSEWIGGHLASPHNYRCDPSKYIETFILPNIAPLSHGLKSKIWTRLEAYIRELTIKCGSVYVYTGPLFMPERITFRNWAIRHQVIGMNTVAVPTHFFKVIIAECKERDDLPYMEGYVLPNADIDNNLELSSFISNIRDIEHFAGLKFYDGARRPQLHHNIQTIDPSL
ncbi:GH24683 [Drosophila grimshawi]|uniref:GH24683 n=1 Tax=Drosophila grimshawi TaxID=7222 RepID=B4JMS5_DROGR|nr:GH24683 [Drosophila grimshawi]